MAHRKLYSRVSDEEARWIRFLRAQGFAMAAIADNVGRSTRSVFHHLQERPNPRRCAQAGKPASGVIGRRNLLRSLIHEKSTVAGKVRPKFCSLAALRAEIIRRTGKKWSTSTLYRDTQHMNYKSYVRPRVCSTAPSDRAARMAFASLHRQEASSRATYVAASRIVFTDEKIFTTNDQSARRMFVCRTANELLPRENKRWGPRVMVWGAIGLGFSYFVVLPKPLRNTTTKEVDELRLNALTSKSYREEVLPNFLRKQRLARDAVFMQDGAKSHTASATLQFLQSKRVTLLEKWPPRSPDLNPIENLWSIMQSRVADEAPHDTKTLIVALNKVFKSLRSQQDMVDRFVLSFNKRCSKVHAANGGWCQ
jgi:transposase